MFLSDGISANSFAKWTWWDSWGGSLIFLEGILSWRGPFSLQRDRVEVIFVLQVLLFSVCNFGSSPRLLLLGSCGSSGEFPSLTLIPGVFVLGRAPLSPDQTFQDLLTFVMYPFIASFLSLGIAPFATWLAALAQSWNNRRECGTACTSCNRLGYAFLCPKMAHLHSTFLQSFSSILHHLSYLKLPTGLCWRRLLLYIHSCTLSFSFYSLYPWDLAFLLPKTERREVG